MLGRPSVVIVVCRLGAVVYTPIMFVYLEAHKSWRFCMGKFPFPPVENALHTVKHDNVK